MTTTLTATPQPATASVLLEVTADAADAPVTMLDLDGPEVWAERAAWAGGFWTGWAGQSGAVVVFDAPVANAGVGRAFGDLPLIAGRRYRATVTIETDQVGGVILTAGNVNTIRPTVDIPAAARSSYSLDFVATGAAAEHELWLMAKAAGSTFRVSRVRVSSVPDGYAFTLTRSDANGIAPVRLYAGQEPVDGTLVAVDYEAALAGPITYAVTTTQTATATTSLDDVDRPWLMVPVLPQYSEPLELVTGYTETSVSATTVHEVINREDALVTLGPLRLRSGLLELWAVDYPTARALRTVYTRGETVMLRQAEHPGMDLYHVCTGRVMVEPHAEDTKPRRWRVSVDYTEVKPPSASLAGALGWTFEASTARNATFVASAAEFTTFTDLAIGPAT